jgi:septal ring factor EnvC (AmiA/AmiB activator)
VLQQLRKLVATQEDLQEQLAAQLAACQAEANAAEEAATAQQGQLQQQLDEAQAAVAALAEELKVGRYCTASYTEGELDHNISSA